MYLHIFDGRLMTLEYSTISVQEIVEYDSTWNNKKEREFAIHDKYDGHYWLQENYNPPCRNTSEELNPVIHGYVLCHNGEVIAELKDEQQGKDIIMDIAMLISELDPHILFLNEDLTVTKKSKNNEQ